MDTEDRDMGQDTITASRPDSDVPGWVAWFQNVARPTVAVIILVMCAPGEHHLAVMAGWSDTLAWGMPGCLVVYTGIAAVVATKRAKGAPGKRTAVAGAILALALAMSAQPVSHLFVTSHWSGDPVALVVIVSCIPPLVAGHLWHLAASPSQPSPSQDVRDVEADAVPLSLVWDKPWTPERDTDTELEDMYSSPSAVVPDSVRRVPSRPVVRSLVSGSVPSVVRDALGDNPDASDADLRDIILNRVGPDTKPDTIRKAIYRARNAS